MMRGSVLGLWKSVAGAILVVLVLVGGSEARGQAAAPPYDVVEVPQPLLDGSPESRRLALDLERGALRVIRGDASLDDAQVRNRFDNFFSQFYFAILTHPDHLNEWADRRTDFMRRWVTQASRSQRVHQHLVNLAVRTMAPIVRGNYHPVARYNAMLLIGELNSTEASTVGDRRPPVPLAGALGFMLRELQNPEQIDAVRVAALNGILRHARIDRDLPAENRRLIGNNAETMIVDAMVQLVTANEPPEGRTLEGHEWIRRRATDVLGMLGSTGQGRVVSALEQVVGDEQAGIDVRCSAAEALGRLNYPADANINVAEIAQKLGVVAASACFKEIERVEQLLAREGRDPRRPGGAMVAGGGYGGPGMFGDPTGRSLATGPADYRVALTRRRVKQQMLQVRSGLIGPSRNGDGGLAAVAGADNGGQQIKRIADAVDEIIAITDDSTFTGLTELVTDLRARVQQMEEDFDFVVMTDDDDEGLDSLMLPLEDVVPDLPLDPLDEDEEGEPIDQLPEEGLPADPPMEQSDPTDEPELPVDQPDQPDLPLDIPDLDLPIDDVEVDDN